jgi:hypothetical protein
MVCKTVPEQPQPQRKHMIDRRARSLLTVIEAAGEPDDVFLTEALADTLNCSPQFLEIGRMASYNYGPPFIRIGASVGYRRSDVCDWLRSRAEFFESLHPAQISRPSVRIIATTARSTTKRAARQ